MALGEWIGDALLEAGFSARMVFGGASMGADTVSRDAASAASGDVASSAVMAAVGTGVVLVSLGAMMTLIALAAAAPHSAAAKNTLDKIHLMRVGIAQMALSKDKKWPARPDAHIMEHVTPTAKNTKTFIFIRHGESDWNEVFNRGFSPVSFLPRLLYALAREISLIPTTDSIFIDSSLSTTGIAQALEMVAFLENDKSDRTQELRGDLDPNTKPSSVIVCSNLRRSVQTALLTLRARLKRTGERVRMMTCLQEVTFNVDGISLSKSREVTPSMGDVAPHLPADILERSVDASLNYGTKSVRSNGMLRMLEFLAWAFAQDERVIIIAGGHSLYLRYMLRNFLPADSDFVGKTKKLSNCGTIQFSITTARHDGNPVYRIDPRSMQVLYGGFFSA